MMASDGHAEKGNATSGVTIGWSNLAYSIADKKAEDGQKWILRPQTGKADPGDFIALMGPSGSGKTSLLNALAGRIPTTKGANFQGDLLVNGLPKGELPCPFADISAYVEQEDVLYALSTTEETLDFAARLRLPSQTPKDERDRRINEVLQQLGLVHVRHTNVGGSSFNGALRGLSGGERKRLSIAVELLHRPKCIFLDEPTTGLDSYQALNVAENLRALADEGHTVVISVHQPRSSIFAMLTGVYLLSAGQPVYCGPADTAAEHFEALGYPMPPKFNPADFLIDIVSIDQRGPEELERTTKRLAGLHEAWARQASPTAVEDESTTATKRNSVLAAKPAAPAGQTQLLAPFLLLLRRSWRENTRDMVSVGIKTAFNFVFAVIFGFVYFQLGRSQQSIQDRMGILFFLTMNIAFGSVINCAQAIPRQITVVNRERANRLYPVLPFYLSTIIVLVPLELIPQLVTNAIMYYMCNLRGSFWIFFAVLCLENVAGISLGLLLSASFSNVVMAAQLAPAVVILFLLFSGFLINEASVPVYFTWLKETSFIRYAFKATAVNEMEGATFSCEGADGGYCITNGEQVLSQLKFVGDDLILQCSVILLGIIAAFNIIALLILLLRKPKFLALTPGGSKSTAAAPVDAVADKASAEKGEVAAPVEVGA